MHDKSCIAGGLPCFRSIPILKTKMIGAIPETGIVHSAVGCAGQGC